MVLVTWAWDSLEETLHRPTRPHANKTASNLNCLAIRCASSAMNTREADKGVAFEVTHPPSRSRFLRFIHRKSNFYRIHLFVFAITPLICGGIFCGVNGESPIRSTAPLLQPCAGEYRVSLIDALFLTYSSMTVTGLSTINLSTTTPLQQFILFALMLLGDVVRHQLPHPRVLRGSVMLSFRRLRYLSLWCSSGSGELTLDYQRPSLIWYLI